MKLSESDSPFILAASMANALNRPASDSVKDRALDTGFTRTTYPHTVRLDLDIWNDLDSLVPKGIHDECSHTNLHSQPSVP